MLTDAAQPQMLLEGTIRANERTKRLIAVIKPGDIALIRHPDLDASAAEGLILAGAKAVVNAANSITGTFPHSGPLKLVQAGIPLFEIDGEAFELIKDGETAVLTERRLACGPYIIPCRKLTGKKIMEEMIAAERDFGNVWLEFVHNTIQFAKQEMEQLLDKLFVPPLKVALAGKSAIVAARGPGCREDVAALADYIESEQPVLVGVDGGADAFLAQGLVPDLIVGDMDSVSDDALKSGAQLLVHAYPDGKAPGMERIWRLGLSADTVRAPGTSEDLALRIAYEQGAERIVCVGTRSHAVDFLEKGRPGMASTFLLRTLIGHRLVDARGLHLLSRKTARADERAAFAKEESPKEESVYETVNLRYYSGMERREAHRIHT
jgi:uncharacterized membrane-anchored protein